MTNATTHGLSERFAHACRVPRWDLDHGEQAGALSVMGQDLRIGDSLGSVEAGGRGHDRVGDHRPALQHRQYHQAQPLRRPGQVEAGALGKSRREQGAIARVLASAEAIEGVDDRGAVIRSTLAGPWTGVWPFFVIRESFAV